MCLNSFGPFLSLLYTIPSLQQGMVSIGSSAQSVLTPGIVGVSSPGGASPSSVALEGSLPQQQGCPNSVLRVIIENMLYPITIDILHQVRSWFSGDGCSGNGCSAMVVCGCVLVHAVALCGLVICTCAPYCHRGGVVFVIMFPYMYMYVYIHVSCHKY